MIRYYSKRASSYRHEVSDFQYAFEVVWRCRPCPSADAIPLPHPTHRELRTRWGECVRGRSSTVQSFAGRLTVDDSCRLSVDLAVGRTVTRDELSWAGEQRIDISAALRCVQPLGTRAPSRSRPGGSSSRPLIPMDTTALDTARRVARADEQHHNVRSSRLPTHDYPPPRPLFFHRQRTSNSGHGGGWGRIEALR